MYQQAQKLVHCSNLYHNDQAGELACTLVNLTKNLADWAIPLSPIHPRFPPIKKALRIIKFLCQLRRRS
ncbi:acetylornithine aminotransferase [Puccinia graminis f. sp. tritici]|uniref:Acetylornithine aminotransferase n=1 Tax=Puccinia graminis f. sp. tritici TaxID=56615 RepID=A0A5B0LM41_PUCGR|nr:acetylornithine aminotransferase [Puccinia graminis f. sp. tritici]